MMFDLWPVYSGERFRASWPSCLRISEASLERILVPRGLELLFPFYEPILSLQS